uniref:Odorant receptor n=1 Tax=Dendrolimus houi TaxID=765132 RepID=A0A076E996_9NEOP|nr:odorant receptor [Dendrolimus houi]
METQLSYLSLKPHIQNLTRIGFYPLLQTSSIVRKMLHNIYMKLVLAFILLYAVQQVIKVYHVKDDPNKVMDTMYLLLTNSDLIFKQIVLSMKVDEIEELLNTMKGPVFNQKQTGHHEFLSRVAQQARVFLWAYNTVALSTCLLWVLYPIMLYSQGKSVEFAIWLPFDENPSPQFYFTITYVWIQTSWVAYGNSTMDSFISFFFAQCKTQLSILRFDLEAIINRTKEEMKQSSLSFDDIFARRFRKIILHYKEIVRFSTNIQNIFSRVILYQFLITGWILCTAAYRTMNMNPCSVDFVSMILYICCMLTEIFVFCYIGNEITHESDLIVESAYMMDWLEVPLTHRKNIIVFMERIKKPIKLIAGFIIPLSNETFISIVRSSYTFYAFLKNTEE